MSTVETTTDTPTPATTAEAPRRAVPASHRGLRRVLTSIVDRVPDPMADAFDQVKRWSDRSPMATIDLTDGNVDAVAFDRLYASSSDPWGYQTSYYEHRRHRLALLSLPWERFRSAFEPGCAAGVFTELLAERCDRLLATDYSEPAVALARQRLARFDHVEVRQGALPGDWPDQRLDLVVLADVGQFLTPRAIDQVTDHALRTLEPGGLLLAVHGRSRAPEIFQTGDGVHNRIRRRGGLRRMAAYRDGALRVDVWERRPR